MQPWQNENLSFEERARDLVSRMTLEEKVSQMGYMSTALPRFALEDYNWWNECLHGVARAGTATVFPQAIASQSQTGTCCSFLRTARTLLLRKLNSSITP